MDEYIFYGAIGRTDDTYGMYYGPKQVEDYVERIGGKILFYVDSDPAKQSINSPVSRIYPGGGVYPPLKIKEYPNAKIVILCSARKEVCEFLRANGVKNTLLATPDFFVFPYCTPDERKNLKDWTQNNEKEIRSFYETGDAVTAKILETSIKQRKMGRYSFISAEEMYDFRYRDYFYDETLVPEQDITLVDGGAFTGDSIMAIHKRSANHIKKIYAFEPDKENLNALEKNLLDMKLLACSTIVSTGMYDEDKTLYFKGGSSSGHVSHVESEISIPVKKIDSVVNDVKGKLMIKMDIEGSEVPAILGAKETIVKHRPYMAICMYHKIEDILAVPKTIRSICPDYKFYIRGGNHYECYAVPVS